MEKICCPNCGESYYAQKYSTCTAMYYPTIMKDGVNINPDGNSTITYCECINCHYGFSYTTRYGEVTDITLGKKLTPIPTLNIPMNTAVSVEVPKLDKVTCNKEDLRQAEIRRLEQEIESLKQQLLEIKANPDWVIETHI